MSLNVDNIRTEDLLGLEQDEMVERLLGPLNNLINESKNAISALGFQNCQIIEVNAVSGDWDWHTVGNTGEPAFENSWVNFDTVWNSAAFRIDHDGIVTLKGLVKNGTISPSLPIFTLPAGFRPARRCSFATVSNSLFGQVNVFETGAVVPQVGSNISFYIDCVRFKAEGNVAIPDKFTGDDWPIRLSHSVKGMVKGVKCISAMKTGGSYDGYIVLPQVSWEVINEGTVKISSVKGLAPGTKYRLSFLIIGE